MNMNTIEMKNIQKEIYKGHLKMGGTNPQGETLGFTNYYMEKNHKPFFGIMAEFHFSRFDYRYWEEEINKIKLSGVNILATYIFWNHHEEDEGIFDWQGNKNLRYFLDLCEKQDIKIVLRIGPWCHGEARNGGFPDWLYGKPVRTRSNDAGYLNYVRRLYDEIGRQVRGHMYKDGGSVIGVQLENEYMTAAAPWEMTLGNTIEYTRGAVDGASHLAVLKNLSVEVGIEVPFYTNTAWVTTTEVEEGVLPLYGAYAYAPWRITETNKIHPPTLNYIYRSYHDKNSTHCTYDATRYPFACCEMMGGMQVWYPYRFVVPPESVEAMSAMKVAGGCNFVGYYMFHGGSNPIGKHSFMNENTTPKISYDFQAPVREYGQLNESYKALKLLHMFYRDFEDILCETTTVLPDNAKEMQETDTASLRYAARVINDSGFLFLNNFQDHLDLTDKNDIQMQLVLTNETIEFPNRESISLKNGVSCILPFNMNIKGALLKYATAQLITKVKDGDTLCYFFFTPEGVKSEYCFDGKTMKCITAENNKVHEDEDYIYVNAPCGMQSDFTIETAEGSTIRICTLTRKEALNLWKLNVWGQERLVLTETGILSGNGYLNFYSVGNSTIHFGVFPKVQEGLKTLTAPITSEKTGLFETYQIGLEERKVDLNVQRVGSAKATVELPKDAFKGVENIFLKIEYTGDVGNAFIDGMLINDNFYNGTPWEIGLKGFIPIVLEKGINFHIVPLKNGKTVVLDDTMALQQEFVGEEIAQIHKIEAVLEYRVMVMANQEKA